MYHVKLNIVRNLSNRTKLYTTLAALAAVIFLIGIVVGYMIGSMRSQGGAGTKGASDAATVNKPNIIVSDDVGSRIVNFYFPDRKRVLGQIPINSYDPERFYTDDNGFMAYHDEEGNTISHIGIDISYHQEHVDWDQVKESGIEFVMLRCGFRGYTEGALKEDERFREYAQACNDRDIPLGVYFFTQAVSVEEAVKEAEFTLDLIKDYKISYPVAIDTEYVSDSGARTNLTEIEEELRSSMCNAFCERVRADGYYPMIYASENWIRRELDYEAVQDYDIWAAQYLEENDFLYDFTIWQYTPKGRIKGINEEVDLDVSMVDYASFVPALREAYVSGGTVNGVPVSVSSGRTGSLSSDGAADVSGNSTLSGPSAGGE
ncbi:MAG: glycoside hydrolase family 25 protein [Lachnospiraceae bacterium]|nr:glycoside hydrolase family 25 protein [Lachnospiraceae bacterium]